ncbi:MAG: outer membrane lipoprotein carrier protein LolA [Proteobacteria bacterium]|nr:outer membrane lipoprotein carrier protein LolA [Pseudomonadota bacterium]
MAPKTLTCALLFLVAGVAPGTADEATTSCAEQVAARIQSRYESVRDIVADFEQSTRSVTLGNSALGSGEVTRGRVFLAKPGRMRWSYEEPQPSLVVTDGSTLWLYDPADKVVQRLPVSAGYLSGASLQFLLGEGVILDEFDVSVDDCSGESVRLDLVPREDKSYERIGLVAIAKTGEVVETTIVDVLGNETRVSFHNLRTNQDPDEALFRFEPPEGVRVIDLETQGTP